VKLRCNGEWLEFETADYSELGMLVRDLEGRPGLLKKGDLVEGTIRTPEQPEIPFKAEVVRVVTAPGQSFYGLEIAAP
jgi:hypothetical protein